MNVTQATLGQTIEDLRLQAVEAARERYNVTLDFSLDSLTKFNTLVDQARQIYISSSVSEQGLDRTVEVWGAYLGETLRRNKGGTWKFDPQQIGDRQVYLTSQNMRLYPFEQVRQKITGQEPILPDRDMPPPAPEPKKPKRKVVGIILIAVGIFAILGIIITMAIMQIKDSTAEEAARQRVAYEAQFLPNMATYLKEYPNPAGQDPELSGKVLIVNKKTGGIANLQYQLPVKLKAASLEDVSVLVQYECDGIDTVTTGEATTSNNRLSCQMTLINFAQKEAVTQQNFTGDRIPEDKRIDERGLPVDEVGGGLDPAQMVIWLEALIK